MWGASGAFHSIHGSVSHPLSLLPSNNILHTFELNKCSHCSVHHDIHTAGRLCPSSACVSSILYVGHTVPLYKSVGHLSPPIAMFSVSNTHSGSNWKWRLAVKAGSLVFNQLQWIPGEIISQICTETVHTTFAAFSHLHIQISTKCVKILKAIYFGMAVQYTLNIWWI